VNDKVAETVEKVRQLLAAINDLHSKLVLWVKARIAQKFKEGEALPPPDPEEHRLLAAIDQYKAEARESIEELLRGEIDPEIRERVEGIREELAAMHLDLDLTRNGDEVE
jgi:hypothetical protein